MIKCPKCNSANLSFFYGNTLREVSPTELAFSKTCQCNECSYKWKYVEHYALTYTTNEEVID